MGGTRRTDFRAKLARLRREGGADADAASAPASRAPEAPSGMPPWLRARLERRGAGASSMAPVGTPGADMDPALLRAAAAWETTTGDPADLTVVEGARGSFAARERRLPQRLPQGPTPGSTPGSTRHGDWDLAEVDHADPAAFARLAGDPALAELDLGASVFLDTETSGLGGGAGVFVYMVGLGWFEPDGTYVSWQGFLRDPGEEPALLQAVADRIGASAGLVSFFGKSFDRHRLEDKMRIAGVTPPFDARPHLDLFHPLRRLTRGAFPDAKLQTMERELLRFRRERDLPGALAPAAWFDYLAGRPHRLEGVFLHNHEDVLSLAVLAAYLGRAEREERASGAALPGPAARRAVALAETAPDRAEARAWAERALERDVKGEDRRRMQVLAAESARLSGDVAAARALYRDALEEEAGDRAAVRLFRGASMLLERAVGDRENALRMAERGLEVARRVGCPARDVSECEARVARLAAAQSR